MPSSKKIKIHPFEKILAIMKDGNPKYLDEIHTILGDQIQMYRISTYMWHIKTNTKGVIRPIKNGRKVVGYQLVNPKDVMDYIRRREIDKFYNTIQTVEDLNLQPIQEKVTHEIL